MLKINIIYGAKGSGKTKKIIDAANDGVLSNLGDVVFLTDTDGYIHELKYQIRLTNTKESGIDTEDLLVGFIKGMTEANYDIRYMYVDGAARMVNKSINELESFLKRLEGVSTKTEVNFFLTVSCDEKELPKFMKKYIK